MSQQLHIVINPIIVLRTVSAEHFDTQSFVLVGHMAAQKGNVRHFFGTMEGVSVKLNLSSPNHFIKKNPDTVNITILISIDEENIIYFHTVMSHSEQFQDCSVSISLLLTKITQ